MKKTLLAAALAVGFAGVAQAETSVTLYGVIDTGISYTQEKGYISNDAGDRRSAKRSKFGIHDGTNAGQAGSRWGLRGTEDLGDGLRVEFQLESGFDVTTGRHMQNDRLFGRQAWVGLAGDNWGSLRFGRQHNVGTDFLLGMIDPFGGGFGLANGGGAFKSIDTNRMDNTIKYVTPNFSGFRFGAAYSFNHDGAQDWKHKRESNKNTNAISVGVVYANGPIGVGLSYDQMKRSANKDETDSKFLDTTAKEWILGGAYDFEVVKVHAAFGQSRNGVLGGRGGYDLGFIEGTGADAVEWSNGESVRAFDKGFKANNYLLGVSAPIGAGTVMASWSMSDPRSKPDRFDGESVDFKKIQTYALGYKYGLSKRTDVYAYGAYKKDAHHIKGNKASSFAVGLTHRF